MATKASRDARLTYIGLWNFSDDYGVVKGHPGFLKNQIFPYEDIRLPTFKKWLLELQDINRIIPFSENGESYFHLPKFLEHQKINRPSQLRNPQCPQALIEDSLTAHGGLPEGSCPKCKYKYNEKGKCKCNEKEERECPIEDIVSLYHKLLPELPKVQITKESELLSTDLPKRITAIWKKRKAFRSLEFWEWFFKQIRTMPFLMGKVKEFTASLFWICGPKNFEKIINGNYVGVSGPNKRLFLNALETMEWLNDG